MLRDKIINKLESFMIYSESWAYMEEIKTNISIENQLRLIKKDLLKEIDNIIILYGQYNIPNELWRFPKKRDTYYNDYMRFLNTEVLTEIDRVNLKLTDDNKLLFDIEELYQIINNYDSTTRFSITPKEITLKKGTIINLYNRMKTIEKELRKEKYIEEFGEPNPIPITQPLNIQEQKESLKVDLLSYFNGFLEHKKNYDKVSDASIQKYKGSIEYLNYFTEEDTELNFSFFKQLQKNLQELPSNFFKYSKYQDITFKELLELKKKENYKTLNPKTINGHITNYRLYFDYLVYEEIIKENPITKIMPLKEDKEVLREELTDEELTNLFNSDLIDKEFINMSKFALYTGLRLGEILTVKKANIKDGLINIDLEDTSNKKHQRIIPIHTNLKDVINYQKKHNKGKNLFFNCVDKKDIDNLGKRLRRQFNKVILEEKTTFHSLRKNFSQEIELNTTAEESVKKYLMGHTMSKNVTHTVYNRGKVNIDKLKNCIEQITFKY
jgi:integrase